MGNGSENSVFNAEYIDCPVCGCKSEHHFLNESLFEVTSEEVDLKPVLKWNKRIHAKYNPHLYYILQCPTCFFSGDVEFFRKPTNDFNFSVKLFDRKAKELAFTDPVTSRVLTVMKADTPIMDFNFTDAIKRYLSAIFFLRQFSSIVEKDSMALGRYCLHYSWLLKDLFNSGFKEDGLKLFRQLEAKLGENWKDFIINPEDALKQALLYYETCLYFSCIPEKMDCELEMLQLVGRLELALGRFRQAQDAFFKCIRNTYVKIEELQKHDMDDSIRAKIKKWNLFAEQTRSFLKASKEPA